MTIVNILLLLTALCGSIAAFGGETWKKGEEPLSKRITRRGWIALTVIVLAFALGVFKEWYGRNAAAAIQLAAAEKEQNLQRALNDANDEIRRIRPALLSALQAATAGIPREIDYPFYEAIGTSTGGVVMGNNGAPLQVYAGQRLKWVMLATPDLDAYLVIGGRRYRLGAREGEIIVAGLPSQPMGVEIRHSAARASPSGIPGFPFQAKMVVSAPFELKMALSSSDVDPNQLLTTVRTELGKAVAPQK